MSVSGVQGSDSTTGAPPASAAGAQTVREEGAPEFAQASIVAVSALDRSGYGVGGIGVAML